MKKELKPKYEHLEVEKGKYQTWVDKEYFKAGDLSKPPFCVVIPPPNVTGKLHLGHAWNTTIQDILVRYKKMRGYDTLWLPGMDHAGIATQTKVEQRMQEQGLNKYEIGREEFLKISWKWKDEYAAHIHTQWAKLGLSLDYSRERFTLDKGLNEAVEKVFITLYEKGLLYRGERIINWDPKQKTALSNIEVIYKETESNMYYFKYFLENSSQFLEVATTRPETMFGDVCVVVNPKDSRFIDKIGKNVINPANGKLIPIIADEYVEIGFGTGAMKCTPAHDPNDFILGEKYGFPHPICMNQDGTMNELAGIYNGLDRFECRSKLTSALKETNLLSKIEKHVNQVGYSERSNVIVEPYLSKQWFVKMKPLAKQVIDYQNTPDKIKFYPERFEKTLLQWMENIEDWCISRQLWWGHRIPAWYNKETSEVYVGSKPPCDKEKWLQDEDVLDTWFSSALWPFSTLGWPSDTEDFKRYYPNTVLITAYDIIFFWVARMVFQGIEFTNIKPFSHTLIHGLIRDSQGRKMSKSLGNGVDPMDIIDQYGVDALRHFLISNASPGLDLRFSYEKVEASWNFINKIWNASRFVMMNLEENFKFDDLKLQKLQLPDKWILQKLNNVIKALNENMEKYEFGVASTYLYNFIWDEYCSWYIEMAKIGLNSDDESIATTTKNVLYYVLLTITKMIHPFMPFVSEELYQTLTNSEDSLCCAIWPEINLEFNDQITQEAMMAIQEIITDIRNMKNENNIVPNKAIKLVISCNDDKLIDLLNLNKKYIAKFTYAESINVISRYTPKEKGKTILFSKGELFLPLSGMVNIDEEIKKIEQEILKLEEEITRSNNLLNNQGFISKAPKDKIEAEENKLKNYQTQLATAKNRLEYYKN